MIAGRLTEYVELRKPVVETDAFGSEKISFPKGRLVHAEVNWKSGHLSQEASELFPDGRVEIIIYSAHPVEEKWRVVYQGITYTVGAIEFNRRKGLKRLICDRVNE